MSASNCKSFLRSRMSLTKIWLRLQPAIAGGRTLWFQMNFQTVQSRPKWFSRCRIKKQQIIIRSELNLTVGQQKHQPPRIPPFFLFPDSSLLLDPPRSSQRCKKRQIYMCFFQLVLIFGPFWVIFGPFWQFEVIFEPIWAILGHFWAILGNFRSFLGHFWC